MTRKIKLIIPAAGAGKRMGLSYPKTLYPIAGKPILAHILESAMPLVQECVVVVSPDGKQAIEGFLSDRGYTGISTAVQNQPIGMADAVEVGAQALGGSQSCDFLIIWGDQVTVQAETLCKVIENHKASGAWLTLPTTWRRDPYIHIVRDGNGNVIGVLEAREGDAMPDEGENDCGVFMARGEHLLDGLMQLRSATCDKATGYYRRVDNSSSLSREFNFLPLITFWAKRKKIVEALPIAVRHESVGVNTQQDAAEASSNIRGWKHRQ